MTVRNPVLLLCERLKINSLKSSFSSARGISAISLRVSPSVLKELGQQSNVSFRFRHCVLASCSSINVSTEPSKEANLELAMLDSRVGVKLAGRDCTQVNFRRLRL